MTPVTRALKNEKSLYLLLLESVEAILNIAFGQSLNEHKWHSHGARRFLRFVDLHFCVDVFRIHKRGKYSRVRN
jgi:hypothetical protein